MIKWHSWEQSHIVRGQVEAQRGRQLPLIIAPVLIRRCSPELAFSSWKYRRFGAYNIYVLEQICIILLSTWMNTLTNFVLLMSSFEVVSVVFFARVFQSLSYMVINYVFRRLLLWRRRLEYKEKWLFSRLFWFLCLTTCGKARSLIGGTSRPIICFDIKACRRNFKSSSCNAVTIVPAH